MMDNDFIRALGYKALDSRLKRISDRMSHDVRRLYKELKIDVEPNWYLVFMLLKQTEKVPISYIAERLGYAHPSAVIIIKKMAAKGYIHTEQNKADKRQQMVSLSAKSLELLPKLELLWDSCEKAILNMIDNELAILKYLDNIDDALQKNTFFNRFKQEYIHTK